MGIDDEISYSITLSEDYSLCDQGGNFPGESEKSQLRQGYSLGNQEEFWEMIASV